MYNTLVLLNRNQGTALAAGDMVNDRIQTSTVRRWKTIRGRWARMVPMLRTRS